tara:strand:- start:2034 stop:2312 length:279 start_codon:yes stop_codon:yes gene_type:complete
MSMYQGYSKDRGYIVKFESWLKRCDALLKKEMGIGLDDMPDALWADYWEQDMSPLEALEEALETVWAEDMSDGVWDAFNHALCKLRRGFEHW